MVVAGLDSSWRYYFIRTYITPSYNNRCQSTDHTWGVAILARATTISPPIKYVLGTETWGEDRVLACLDFTVGFNMRICTTHLTQTSQAVAAQQAVSAANSINSWIAAGKAVIMGGDFNLDVRECGNGNILNAFRPWYYGSFGAGASLCYSGGTGSMYEVDHYRAGGDGTYDEKTIVTSVGSRKFDYTFGNRQNMLGDYGGDATTSYVSDHDPLRGAITAHD